MNNKSYRITAAGTERRGDIFEFVLSTMKQLYAPGTYNENPADLAHFDEIYVKPDHACFFLAENEAGRIIGTAAVRPYDGRFPFMEPFFQGPAIGEVTKFYVSQDYRGQGVGSALYAEWEAFARRAGYTDGYLHTELHLPGGYPFWKSRGYEERYWATEQLVHMTKRIVDL